MARKLTGEYAIAIRLNIAPYGKGYGGRQKLELVTTDYYADPQRDQASAILANDCLDCSMAGNCSPKIAASVVSSIEFWNWGHRKGAQRISVRSQSGREEIGGPNCVLANKYKI